MKPGILLNAADERTILRSMFASNAYIFIAGVLLMAAVANLNGWYAIGFLACMIPVCIHANRARSILDCATYHVVPEASDQIQPGG